MSSATEGGGLCQILGGCRTTASGLSRHLSAYAFGPDRAALAELEFVGRIYDLAFRLRGSTTSAPARVQAIAIDVGLANRDLRQALTALESLSWVTVERDNAGAPVSVIESLPPAPELIAASSNLLDITFADKPQRAALAMLRATTLQPLLRTDALDQGIEASGCDDAAAESALGNLIAVGLIRVSSADAERDVLYNPNVWTQGDSIATAALNAADARATQAIQDLLEELAESPGLPEAKVTSTESRWVEFAVRQGLVQRSVIQTTEGGERGFLFTLHLRGIHFGGTAGDAWDTSCQLVGSMIYASTYAKNQLHSPDAFLRALIRNGVAGDATSIGTDYPMLEKSGIVRVVPSSGTRFRLELLQSDVAESALKLIQSSTGPGGSAGNAAALRASAEPHPP